MNKDIKELALEKAEDHKEVSLGVSYYGGTVPYAILYESLDHAQSYDVAYKIKLPYRRNE